MYEHKKRVIEDSLAKIQGLHGITFERSDQMGVGCAGVAFDEVREVLPQAVKENHYGQHEVDYAGVVALLVEGMKELQEKVSVLETDVETLRKKASPIAQEEADGIRRSTLVLRPRNSRTGG